MTHKHALHSIKTDASSFYESTIFILSGNFYMKNKSLLIFLYKQNNKMQSQVPSF